METRAAEGDGDVAVEHEALGDRVAVLLDPDAGLVGGELDDAGDRGQWKPQASEGASGDVERVEGVGGLGEGGGGECLGECGGVGLCGGGARKEGQPGRGAGRVAGPAGKVAGLGGWRGGMERQCTASVPRCRRDQVQVLTVSS
ncbi:MAG: hypothetical protein HND58_09015 [Planctomycetota bacterium]|nr:MAG: hypothetical protein HND58_09015 [Planctomycetota bacterium]